MFRVIAFAVLALASAEVIFEGPCPEVKPVRDFEFEAYQGTWYEIAKYPNAGEEGAKGKCTVAEYTVDGDKGKVRNTHVVDGIRSYIEGDLTLVGPSKVMLTYTFNGLSKNSFLTVLDTDYKSYALGYSCKYFKDGNKHQVFAWIKSRSKKLDCEAKYKVEEYLKSSKILDSTKYVLNDHSEGACQASATRAITEFLK
ncbi:bilin-binding protein-like [Battus philenor]|uniref:bilin-binding protein-like n=1 Tax=Battus philenor TaxID=42288 RepID=UPI0035D085A9